MTTTKEYVINNLMAFSIVGIIIKLFFTSNITKDGLSGPANASLWGYGVVSLSVFAVMFLSFSLASNMNNLNKNMFGFIKELLSDSLPSLLTLFVLVWLVTLNVTYFKRINQGKVSSEYNQFSNVNTVFLVIQIIVLFMFLRNQISGNSNDMSKMSYVIYIMTFINIILISMMNIILRFFSTDG
jgi:hypothetical protein